MGGGSVFKADGHRRVADLETCCSRLGDLHYFCFYFLYDGTFDLLVLGMSLL